MSNRHAGLPDWCRLEGVEALLEAAPQRPWWFGDDGVYSGAPRGGSYGKQPILRWSKWPSDGVANIVVNGPNDLDWAVARIKRLEAALKAAKREHLRVAWDDLASCPLTRGGAEPVEGVLEISGAVLGRSTCGCGAAQHNVAIDAVLREDS